MTFTVLKTGSRGGSRVLANSKASSRLNLSDHFLSRSAIFVSVEEVVDLPWLVEEVGGRLEVDLAGLSDLGLVECLASAFFAFYSTGPLKPEAPGVLWPSTTPTTDTSAGSTRVGLRVSESWRGVYALASSLF